MPGPIEFSGAAVEALKQQVAKRETPPTAVRIGVKGGACSGLQYVLMFEDAPRLEGHPLWEHFWDVGGVNVVVDKKSATLLSGTLVDWRRTLMKQGFEFINPNEASRCGCGQSFSPK